MKKGESYLPEPFFLSQSTLIWLAQKHPLVDIAETLEVFQDKSRARGWHYVCWQSAFKNYVRFGRQYGGVVFKSVNVSELRWRELLAKTRAANFREPEIGESWQGFKDAFDNRQPRQNVIQFGHVVKRVAK